MKPNSVIITTLLICITLVAATSCKNNTKRSGNSIPVPNNLQNSIEQGWELNENGPMNSVLNQSYGFSPMYGTQDNYFDISLGGNLDILVKVVECSSDKCIRCVFVGHGKSITINQIPQGQYYLKIAYGNNWIENEQDGIIQGKFADAYSFERSIDTFDFGKKNSQSWIDYQLYINVEENVLGANFTTKEISEKEFSE